MDNYLQTITPQVGDKWHADEVWLKINGDKKYLFAMMDHDTRFWIAQEVANSKFKHDAQNLLKKGKQLTKKIPSVFVTDGLPAYRDAFKKEFAPKNDLQKPSEHIKEIHFKNQRKNNNIEERLNGEFRDREKTFRGLKKDDSPAIAGIQLYHNYLRPHSSLNNDTPADRAGVIIKGDNKWITIIQNASKSPET
jgi:transposase-like protein